MIIILYKLFYLYIIKDRKQQFWGVKMKKILLLDIFFIIIFFMLSCTEKISEVEPHTFELVGESTVYTEEGIPYVDQGVLINGELSNDVSYLSNVDIKRAGTYYIEFMYEEKTLIRTVIVTDGAPTIYKRMVEELKNALSYKFTQNLQVSYKNNEEEVDYYHIKAFDVYEDYTYGYSTFETVNGSIYLNEYTYINRDTKKIERYAYDDYGFWYFENMFFETSDIGHTAFALDYFSYITRELIEEDYVYTVYLKPGGYERAFFEYINYIDHVGYISGPSEPLKLRVYTHDEHITRIEADISDILANHLKQPNTISDLSYTFIYEFSDINQLDPIVIPDEALASKNA